MNELSAVSHRAFVNAFSSSFLLSPALFSTLPFEFLSSVSCPLTKAAAYATHITTPGPDVYTGPGGRRLRRAKNPHRLIKQQCRSECEGERPKWKCVRKCVQRKEREELLNDGLLDNSEKDRLCMEKCKDLGQKWPEKPKCFNNCINGNIEAVGAEKVSQDFQKHNSMMWNRPYAGGQWRPQSWRPLQRPYGFRQPSYRQGSAPTSNRPRSGRPELSSGNGFAEGWSEIEM